MSIFSGILTTVWLRARGTLRLPAGHHHQWRGHGPTAAIDTNRFNIPAQDLGSALTLFGQQSDREIVFSPEATRAKKPRRWWAKCHC
jgi:hypothetical protein